VNRPLLQSSVSHDPSKTTAFIWNGNLLWHCQCLYCHFWFI